MKTAVRTSFVHTVSQVRLEMVKCSVIYVPDTKPQLEQAHSQVLQLSLKKSPMKKYWTAAEKNEREHIAFAAGHVNDV